MSAPHSAVTVVLRCHRCGARQHIGSDARIWVCRRCGESHYRRVSLEAGSSAGGSARPKRTEVSQKMNETGPFHTAKEDAQKTDEVGGWWNPTPTKDGVPRGQEGDFVAGIVQNIDFVESKYGKYERDGKIMHKVIDILADQCRRKGENVEIGHPIHVRVALQWAVLQRLVEEKDLKPNDYIYIEWKGKPQNAHVFKVGVDHAAREANREAATRAAGLMQQVAVDEKISIDAIKAREDLPEKVKQAWIESLREAGQLDEPPPTTAPEEGGT